MLAAEYVLGVLGIEERREVERRSAAGAGAGAEVAFWEERLGGLADAVALVPPPPQLWSRINAVISAAAAAGGRAAAVRPVAVAEPRILARSASAPARSPPPASPG